MVYYPRMSRKAIGPAECSLSGRRIRLKEIRLQETELLKERQE